MNDIKEGDRHSSKKSKSKAYVAKFLARVKRAMEPLQKNISVIENDVKRFFAVERRGLGILDTSYGKFWQYSFAINDQWEKYSVIVKVDKLDDSFNPLFKNKKELVVRTDSGCETGQLFGDRTCECCGQLHLAMQTLTDRGEGMIINIPRQDGRGMGLTFKLGTLWLQDELGVDTVESAQMLALGGAIDVRTYSGVVCILRFFGINEDCKIDLATNNPKKMEVFTENGYEINGCLPIVIKPTRLTRKHLQAKQDHLGHKGLVSHPTE